MRFRSAVLLATLAIAPVPVCAENIKDSDERRGIGSTLLLPPEAHP